MDPFKGWAILELMGHRRLAGFVQEVTLAGAGMLRIDVPSKDGDATQFFQPASIYALTPCSEATARAVAGAGLPAPVNEWELPSLRGKALPASRGDFDEIDADEDETPRETLERLVNEDGLPVLLRGLIELHESHDVDGDHREHRRYAQILEAAREAVLDADEWALRSAPGQGVTAIAEARDSQIAQGYDAAHDDALEQNGALGCAAAWLLVWGGHYNVSDAPEWATTLGSKFRYQEGSRPDVLARAGALIAAEIDRLKRAEAKASSAETIGRVSDTNSPPIETIPPAIETDPDATAGDGVEMCGVLGPEKFICTKPIGHNGDHVAHGSAGEAIERWAPEAPPAPEPGRGQRY